MSARPKQDSAFKTIQQRKREDAFTAYGFLAPALIVFTVFLFIPIAFALFVSTTDWNGISPLGQVAQGATGDVLFTNLTDEDVTIEAGTIVATGGSEPVQFATQAGIVVPANGTQTVEVKALDDALGNDSNTPSGRVLNVPEALAGVVEVTNELPISGGRNAAYEFVGLENYNSLLFEQGLAQRDFFLSLKNTVYFVLGVVPTQTVLALLLAVILNQRWLRFKGAFRTAFYFPSVTSSVVISLVFMWMFTRSGIINVAISAIFPAYDPITWLDDPSGVLHSILGVFGVTRDTVGEWASNRFAGITFWDWLSGPSVTMLSIMILNTWTTIGTLMVIYLAALQNIPSSVYEAAQIDGATSWQTFRRITIPLLAPTTFFVVTLGLIGTFQVFDQIFVISSGGPAKTTLTMAYIVYQNGFNNSDMGLAAATALILFVIIFAFTMLQRLFTSERVQQ